MLDLSENKPLHKKMTDKNNGLSSAQEVLYAEDYTKAEKATKQDKKPQKDDNKDDNKKSDK